MAQIRCTTCSSTIPVEDVELATKLARCRTCDSVFEIGTQLRRDDAVRRRELHPPASVRVARGNLEPRRENGEGEQGYRSRIAIPPSDVELEVRWFQPKAIFTMFFAIIWCGFLVVWYSIALQTPSPGGFMLWFPLLHVAVGVGLAYWSLAMLLNRTRIALGGGRLRTTHGPILWRGGSDLDVGSIRGFYAESRSTRGKRGRVTVTWSVCADVENNPRQALLKGLTSEDEARFLSRALSEQLGVPLTTNE